MPGSDDRFEDAEMRVDVSCLVGRAGVMGLGQRVDDLESIVDEPAVDPEASSSPAPELANVGAGHLDRLHVPSEVVVVAGGEQALVTEVVGVGPALSEALALAALRRLFLVGLEGLHRLVDLRAHHRAAW